MKRKHFFLFFFLVFCAGLIFTGKGLYIFIKAQIAQILLENSWEKAIKGKNDLKPWPWADFRPVACLFFPDYNYTAIVVNSANGTSLAFAPGHLDGSAMPGSKGNCVIFGHRDTQFGILQHVKIDDDLLLSLDNGKQIAYKVTDIKIINMTDTEVLKQTDETIVTLITCYPFTSIFPDNKRFVVIAKLIREELFSIRKNK